MANNQDTAERFWNLVKKSTPNGCWEWQGTLLCGGRYGGFKLGRIRYAHRMAWRLERGEIPAGMHVLHICDNGRCVNPAHLFLGTHADNMRDMSMKGRGCNAKLSPLKVRAMRGLHKTGMFPYRRLSRLFGVTYPHVGKVVRRDVWKQI